jgi:hypothetical protein
VHQRDTSHKPPAKVKRTKEEMQTILKNKKKVAANFPINVLKRRTKLRKEPQAQE